MSVAGNIEIPNLILFNSCFCKAGVEIQEVPKVREHSKHSRKSVDALKSSGQEISEYIEVIEEREQINREQSLDKIEIIQFPNVMAGLAGDFANLYSSYLEVPPHFLLFHTQIESMLRLHNWR